MSLTEDLLGIAQERMTPNYNPAKFILDKGDGARVWDVDGNEYLDFTSGIAVNSLGHAHPKVVAAIQEQAAKLSHTSNVFHHEPYLRMCELLCEKSFGERVFLCNSGAEAVELSLKMARLYFHSRGETRTEFVTTVGGFHGRTLGALSVTHNPKYREGFEPLMPGCTSIPFNDLEAAQAAIGPQTAAIIVEPIQGNSGVAIPDAGYLDGLRAICDDAGALFICDEIQTGGGRTGKWFDYQWSSIKPDIMPLAKAIGGGMPLGAVVTTEAVSEPLVVGKHGSTYGGNPVACRAGLETFKVLEDEGLLQAATERGRHLCDALETLKAKHPHVVTVRGRGLMIGVELSVEARPVYVAARKHGLLVTMAGTNVLRILPPLNVTVEQIEQCVSRLDATLSDVFG
ncbi:MAG: aspartate aminotransferase family protein [Myxococcota bacterium]|nr:aspartate aminotransferase family protein [Myxococcota bacterium]